MIRNRIFFVDSTFHTNVVVYLLSSPDCLLMKQIYFRFPLEHCERLGGFEDGRGFRGRESLLRRSHNPG